MGRGRKGGVIPFGVRRAKFGVKNLWDFGMME
jgi:hypothetical protein